jgi:hypothetical protein
MCRPGTKKTFFPNSQGKEKKEFRNIKEEEEDRQGFFLPLHPPHPILFQIFHKTWVFSLPTHT